MKEVAKSGWGWGRRWLTAALPHHRTSRPGTRQFSKYFGGIGLFLTLLGCRRQSMELALGQARYEAGRCFSHFDAVDRENRLVALELEKRWDDALIKRIN